MKDPLHVSIEDLTVSHNGKKIVLNKRLLDRQNCWDKLDVIKTLHKEKLKLYSMMENTNDAAFLKSADQLLTGIEFELQDAWGFPRDQNFHRFWERPKCQCPSMDNSDMYPHQQYINQSCPLHGK